MQDRYAGDVGDFGKLGLLRALEASGLTVGVNWYLTPNESHNDDGRHVEYLEKEDFRVCDEELWRGLGQLVRAEQRSIRAIEASGLLRAVFFSEPLDLSDVEKAERTALRRRWHARALDRLSGCGVIFADPDNGLIVPSAAGTAKENKFALPEELAGHYRRGASVICYQHKARKPDSFYAEAHNRLVRSDAFADAAGSILKFVTTSQRYYLFMIRPEHRGAVIGAVDHLLKSDWGRHFCLI